MKSKLEFKDVLTLVISVLALLISGYTFIDSNFLHQHMLKASIINIKPTRDSLSCNILLVNIGKSYETLYEGRFIFSDDLKKGGGSLSNETIGPLVLPPNQSIVVRLTTGMPKIRKLRDQGIIPSTYDRIHVGVLFDIVDKKGNLPEDGKIYKITQLEFDSSGNNIGAVPQKDDNEGMINLLY